VRLVGATSPMLTLQCPTWFLCCSAPMCTPQLKGLHARTSCHEQSGSFLGCVSYFFWCRYKSSPELTTGSVTVLPLSWKDISPTMLWWPWANDNQDTGYYTSSSIPGVLQHMPRHVCQWQRIAERIQSNGAKVTCKILKIELSSLAQSIFWCTKE
jgi:hypothetical protein